MHHQITNTQCVSHHKSLVQYKYQSNPYHNATHAAAVVYGMPPSTLGAYFGIA